MVLSSQMPNHYYLFLFADNLKVINFTHLNFDRAEEVCFYVFNSQALGKKSLL